MEKILIRTDENGYKNALAEIQSINNDVAALDKLVQEYLEKPLTQKIFSDVVLNHGSGTVNEYRKIVEADIVRAKITSLTAKRNLLAGVDEFEDLIYKSRQSLSKAAKYASYITIEESKAVVTEEAKKRLLETFQAFAVSPEQIEIFHTQKKAAEVLTKLRTLMVENSPNTSFLNFFHDLFEIKGTTISPKPLNYSLFQSKKKENVPA